MSFKVRFYLIDHRLIALAMVLLLATSGEIGFRLGCRSRDSKGNYLDGGKNYKLNIPKDTPAEAFIYIDLYDPQTRSLLQTGQPLPSYSSERDKDKVSVNSDGSVDLYFGPKAPAGKENNWLQTVPVKGWFTLLRLYSPTEAWFEGKWLPGEFEPVD